MTNIRELSENNEEKILSKYAKLSKDSLGRNKDEEKCPIRTDFQRDRDRIIHSKSFRRMKHKTQVFISPYDDHFRTRLTHSLEVFQISTTIARALRLNEDLVSAIALGHDLGHAPFGHAGESALDKAIKKYNPELGFHHAKQSLRVIDFLEKNGIGLNLTKEVRDGIVGHSKGIKSLHDDNIDLSTLEAQVVRIADRIAYINHDIDDAIRAGLITSLDIIKIGDKFGEKTSNRISSMVSDLIDSSIDKPKIFMSNQIAKELDTLKDFMFEKVYYNKEKLDIEAEYAEKLQNIFDYYLKNFYMVKIPEKYTVDTNSNNERYILINDYISSMTDNYAQARLNPDKLDHIL